MILRVGPLAVNPLDAAAQFHAEVLPAARAALQGGEELTLVFAPADHTHRGWRLAVVQELARDHAPLRVNALCGGDEQAIVAAADWLGRAPGVTGQYLPLDAKGAGALV
ncbi:MULTISPECIES: Rossmann fold domain-containing protein [Novosphingobium]|uniref:Rossmann fold domain-containing protein n=1 Tax=Novosphingobium clariflavum TaxID=2029884 RepID=A0ABV6S181_9SPHN|nr:MULTISPECIES: hypothetical protein [Novosphingobium]QDK33832.1 hypothetical protein DM450_13810 [Sphingomonas sp. IC081]QSR17393.1 hypothetical protein CA833_09390 [Novosphingobium sp. KA1]